MKQEKPYKDIEGNLIIYRVSNGDIQHLDEKFPEGKFKQVIRRCWSLNITSRPSFNNMQSSFDRQKVSISNLKVLHSILAPMVVGLIYYRHLT